ncbi:MAG TPA: dienelactone hydrolase family protein [Candidatus Sulfotelmatobacter sp.]|nr:dienelactone hydrolase family protein [Candidatus Sulfotelmatobacter sp.]
MGANITLKAGDGHQFAAYRVEPKGKPKGAMVVVQEIFGVNSHIREVAEGFAADGYLAIAPALFDRAERNVELGYSQADIGRGRDIRMKVPWEQAMLDTQAAVDAAKGAGKVGIVGYCWGGSVVWLAAARAKGLAAAVGYYGGAVAQFADEKLACPVMLHFGDKDASIPLTDVAKVQKAHPEVTVHIYEADHGFNCDHRGQFNAAAAKLARERTLAFLAKNLG